jgi:hypothetical protein
MAIKFSLGRLFGQHIWLWRHDSISRAVRLIDAFCEQEPEFLVSSLYEPDRTTSWSVPAKSISSIASSISMRLKDEIDSNLRLLGKSYITLAAIGKVR